MIHTVLMSTFIPWLRFPSYFDCISCSPSQINTFHNPLLV
eukprot:UN28412